MRSRGLYEENHNGNLHHLTRRDLSALAGEDSRAVGDGSIDCSVTTSGTSLSRDVDGREQQ